MRRAPWAIWAASGLAVIVVAGAGAGGTMKVVRDQELADATRQHALADLATAVKHYAALDAALQASQPKFAQEVVAFSTAKNETDFGNLYLVSAPGVSQAELATIDDYLAAKRDIASFQAAAAPIWVREPDARTVVRRLEASIDAYRQAQKAAVELAGQYRFLSDVALVYVNLFEPLANLTPDTVINNASQIRLTLNGVHQDMANADLSPTFARYVAILDALVSNYSDYAEAFKAQNQSDEDSALRRVSNDVNLLASFDWIGASRHVDSKFAAALSGFGADLASADGA